MSTQPVRAGFVERRRSTRLTVRLVLIVCGSACGDGEKWHEQTCSLSLNAHGVLVPLAATTDSRADAYYPESGELGGKAWPRNSRRPLVRGPHRSGHRIHGACARFLAYRRRVRTRGRRLGIRKPASVSIGLPTPWPGPGTGAAPQICCYLVPPHCKIGPISPELRSIAVHQWRTGPDDRAAEVSALDVPGPVRKSPQTGQSWNLIVAWSAD